MLVLYVIGVVDALTIPGISQNMQNRQIVTRLKKVYATLSQVYPSLVVDNDGSGVNGLEEVLNGFASKMPLLNNCGYTSGCWYNQMIFNISKT